MRGVVIHFRCEFAGVSFPAPKLKKLIRAVCNRFGLPNAAVDIVIVDNKLIRRLNEKFLHRKSVTDCLAFDLSLPDGRRSFELIVNGQKAKSEAAKRGHSPQAELALYVTHALLHNLGFDDLAPAEAKIMHRLEDDILQHQGFGRVYDRNITRNEKDA